MRYTAWALIAPNEKHGCVLSDISEDGARIDVEDSKKIPDRFFLLLSVNGKARRACQVIWRKPQQVGVHFERKLTGAEAADLASKHTAGMVPEPV